MAKNKNLQPIIYIGLIVTLLAVSYYSYKTNETIEGFNSKKHHMTVTYIIFTLTALAMIFIIVTHKNNFKSPVINYR